MLGKQKFCNLKQKEKKNKGTKKHGEWSSKTYDATAKIKNLYTRGIGTRDKIKECNRWISEELIAEFCKVNERLRIKDSEIFENTKYDKHKHI